ncbi:hypothetical protein, partial [Staphylococcus sp. GDY8P73P]|uniref:hypothetical protein n=1 Tax=Staphylococcus sp. GDY8P73P TaxID=2804134 RepID=UPI001FD9BE9C
ISGYNESLISKIHYNQIKEGYNEREKYKTQSKLYYFKIKEDYNEREKYKTQSKLYYFKT